MYEGCLRINSFTSIAEKNAIVPDFQVYHSQEIQRRGKRNTIKKYRRSDPIRCVAVMKLARSVFADKEQSSHAQFMLDLSRWKHINQTINFF